LTNPARKRSHLRGAVFKKHTRTPDPNLPADRHYLNGDIAELLVYNEVLTIDEINEVGFYLGDKYSISNTFVPEPSTFALAALGLLGLLGWRRRRCGCRARFF